jgi:hypothetical protein
LSTFEILEKIFDLIDGVLIRIVISVAFIHVFIKHLVPYLNIKLANKFSETNLNRTKNIERQLEEHTQDDCLLLTSQLKTHSDCQLDQYIKEAFKQKKCC